MTVSADSTPTTPHSAADTTTTQRTSFRQRQFAAREQAILDATNRLLATKGYDMMAMDDIATEVGIAKGSLYRHFDSKEALAAAVMTRLLERTRRALEAISPRESPITRLRMLLAWTLRERLAGAVPHLPSTSPALQAGLLANAAYLDTLMAVSEDIGTLIAQARERGELSHGLRDEFVLYTLYARSCDPALDFLKATGSMTHDEIVEQMVDACFNGLAPQR